MTNLQVFSNEAFGEIRVMEQNGKQYFCGKDVAIALGYKDTKNALKQHCRTCGVVKRHLTDNLGRKQEAKFIDEGNLYRLITHSKLESAEAFETWVFDEVLPTIRKTGSYIAKESAKLKEQLAEAKLNNSRARRASIYLKLADRVTVDTFKQVLYAKSAEALNGEMLLPLPELPERTYTAEEIGRMLGISGQMVGKLTNAHNLKTAQFGQWAWDKAKYSNKEVQTFRYFKTVADKLREILEVA